MDEQLLREFLAEADERIEALFGDVERLRRIDIADGRARRAIVARIFRHVHTLKGSAAGLPQLASLNRLAHEFENLLDAVRGGRAPLTEATVDACEDATNALSLVVERAVRGDATAEPPPAVIEQLRQHASPGALDANAVAEPLQTSARPAAPPLPAEIERDLSAVERQHLNESVSEGADVLVLAAAFDLATLDEHFGRFTGALGECGEIISTFPGDLTADAPGDISFRILYATTSPRAEIEARLAPFGARVAWTGDAPGTSDAQADGADGAVSVGSPGDEPAAPGVDDESKFHDAPGAAGVGGASERVGDERAPVFVRVPLHELDELVTATHELFTDMLSMLEQTEAGEAAAAMAGAAARAASARRLREDFSALEERVMALRMQPLMPVLERAARAARIAARAAGKEIELEVAGGEVRVDRSLAEQIGEPLLHLLRNAIDHGIETAEERRAAGKPVRGRVRLEVGAEGSRVRVRVADDGRGVEAGRVARSAIAQGLLPAGATVTEEQALRLIFRPGFSTAGRVSDVSGRGVGLDVVEHALERAGGELRVRSTSGEGTTFELRVPLMLALVTVSVVRANGHAYALDAGHVVATTRLEPDDIAGDETQRTTLWQGERLPLVSLRSLLGDTSTTRPWGAGESLPACIVRRERDDAEAWQSAGAPERFAIAVDEIEGEREALVRSLGRHATRWRGVSGAFEQRDGTVALLLDLPRLLGQ
ncbi:MAG TPA: ATP-binding protein [Pyrinomonadaceae bacterium]|jgi:two-component system chemotaxis sensor kinase CheA